MARPETPHRAEALSGHHRDRLPLLVAVVLAVTGLGYRLGVLLATAPPTNSDEATMGLAALHIAEGRHLPAFFYGQHYMGTVEAYLAAPLLAWTGPSVLALRLPNLLLYGVFLALLWLLTRRLYSPWLATATVGLLALGSDRILKNQLIAGGGYPESNPLAVLLLLLSVALALGRVRPQVLGYAGWGLVAGLLVWDHWLVLPYVAAAGALLLVTRRGRLLGRAGAALLAGALAGAAPLIWHSLDSGRNPVSVFLGLNGGAGSGWWDRLYGGVLFGLPMGTGMCDPSQCRPWQLWWGVAYPVLLVAAGVLAWRGWRRATNRAAGLDGPAFGDGERQVRQAGRLALVVAAGLSLLLYARSDAAGSTPVESARYLHCLLISTPAVLWPLWRLAAGRRTAASTSSGRRCKEGHLAMQNAIARCPSLQSGAGERSSRPGVRFAARTGLAAVLATALLATGALVTYLPGYSRVDDQRRELIAALRAEGISHVYADYWNCNIITFATSEDIVCAVLGDDLRAGLDRYAPYRTWVAATPRPAYVLPAGSPLSLAVAAHLRRQGLDAQPRTVGGRDIYWPQRPAGLPLP